MSGAGAYAEALLVACHGSAPLAPGARMRVGADGSVEGSVSAGCVEGAVAQEALALLAGDGAPRLLSYGISDELAGEAGLTCGGTIEVLVHVPSAAGAAAGEVVARARAEGRAAALATVVDGPSAGAALAFSDGALTGDAGALPDAVARDLQAVVAPESRRRAGQPGPQAGRLVVYGQTRVLVEVFAPPPRLAIVGANDFSAALAPLARAVGWAPAICDPRSAFARAHRFSAAAEVTVAAPGPWVAAAGLGPRDALLVFSHDPKHDEPALLAALATDVGFIGALGSRRTASERRERLRAHGLDERALDRVRSPCGLDVGAATPQETAVSVLAELLAVRAGRSGQPLVDTDGPVQAREVGGHVDVGG